MSDLITKDKKNRMSTPVAKGKRLNYNAALQERYNRQIQSLVSQMTEQTERNIRKLCNSEVAEEYFTEDASISVQARILSDKLMSTFSSLFNKKAKGMAAKMLSDAEKASKANLHSSLKEMSGGLSIKTSMITPDIEEVISSSMWENVQLIKSIASEYLSNVQGQLMRSIQQGGNGLADLVPYLESQKDITKRRARNIALDQTRKAYNNINSERMKVIGIKKFEWIHSGGGVHPRKEHIAMNGKIYNFDDLPVIGEMYGSEVRGIPGQLPNCRCTMAPVVDFDEE